MEYFLWKIRNGFITVWLSFCFIVSLITIIVYFTIDEPKYSKHQIIKSRPLKFETLLTDDILDFKATWVSDEDILTQDDNGNIILLDVNKSIKSILAFNSMQHMKYCHKYELSADKKYILIAYNLNKTYSYLSTAIYDVINIKSGKQVTLRDTKHNPREIMIAKWSPTDSSLAIVDNYNIYFIPTVAKPNHVKQITFHGSEDLYNGIPDWVYTEEIFGSNSAMWFSNQGKYLAYATFNEKLVPTVYLPTYGIPDTMYDQYSRMFSYRYPKADDPNPIVELFVQILNITNDEPIPISIKPVKQYTNETILYSVGWSDDEHLFAMWMNRIQNESHLVHYHISNNKAEVMEMMEFRQKNGWLNFQQSLVINPQYQIALIYPTEQDDGDMYRHVCVISSGKIMPITTGKFEVDKLIKWDFELNYIYYLSNIEHSSEVQHVYRVLIDLNQKPTKPECLTCNTGCTFSKALLSEKNTYYAHICTGPNIPYVNIMKTNGDHITAWETNKKLTTELKNVALPRVTFFNVPLTDGCEARVKLLIPPTVDTSSGNKYPLLIYTYGGPTFNIALDEFNLDLNMYLSINHDIVVAEVDGRGTGRRGSNTLFANYKKLGTVEIYDQMTIAKFLSSNMSFVDKNKVGIWGWSYGGYMAGMALAKDVEDVFKCALSVSPITDWIYYDSMFTERLMDTYNQNVESYRNASFIENSDGLHNKKYMVIHGLADLNVHFQHSVMLSKELQHNAITFHQQFYPDETHKLLNVRNHLYRTIILFILRFLI
ncbi:venom dipeptidyl peptidase 4 isoform X1 [Acyrthosiphon pisum]|uniref:Venom dipeptidyl peptidase 4 n=1 Tax=Acyrthosiphon pisum TaxID=7029 RepID=A0A8R2HA36_ACYPI|nr:venom dipeptidyl peptidase 4 isoform X1 [Acyrthosiphon pisum]|eukprot:XP_016661848.1 PREDICTED: venom dipeptidyl peptidase 4 isoform X1 [Acyrthosiphon pisum]